MIGKAWEAALTDRIELHSRVGPDGTLDLHIPLGQSEAGTQVIVTIRPASAQTVSRPVPDDWHRFVEETYGSCADLALERQPQGKFEDREGIE